MRVVVVDTNVLLVANQAHENASNSCVAACTVALLEAQRSGIVVIDDDHRMIAEYLNRTRPNQPKGVGDVFLKWLLRNHDNHRRVRRFQVTELQADFFEEFPNKELQARFDRSDRIFVAVANAHRVKFADEPIHVLQAADCKWLDWWIALAEHGISVGFICPDDVLTFYRRKFPNRATPALPQQ